MNPSAGERAMADDMVVTDRADGVTVINDAFTATSESMCAALRALAALAGDDRPSIAVLGELPELGDAATELHTQIGRLVAELGIGQLITVGGSNAVAMANAARACGSIALMHVGIANDNNHAQVLLKYSLHGRDVGASEQHDIAAWSLQRLGRCGLNRRRARSGGSDSTTDRSRCCEVSANILCQSISRVLTATTPPPPTLPALPHVLA